MGTVGGDNDEVGPTDEDFYPSGRPRWFEVDRGSRVDRYALPDEEGAQVPLGFLVMPPVKSLAEAVEKFRSRPMMSSDRAVMILRWCTERMIGYQPSNPYLDELDEARSVFLRYAVDVEPELLRTKLPPSIVDDRMASDSVFWRVETNVYREQSTGSYEDEKERVETALVTSRPPQEGEPYEVRAMVMRTCWNYRWAVTGLGLEYGDPNGYGDNLSTALEVAAKAFIRGGDDPDRPRLRRAKDDARIEDLTALGKRKIGR